MEEKGFRHLLRIADTDLDGNKVIYIALTKIKGVGYMFSNMICNELNIDKSKKTGTLSDDEIRKLDNAIRTPQGLDVPAWMINRRNDYETGEDQHIIGANMKFVQDNDKKRLQKIKTYRGLRHSWGLPVRGQKTKSNFRRNKGKVQGVRRKKGKGGRV